MTLSEGVHGAGCHARTLPMRCKYCGDAVYYFACDHGLKLLLDELGAPWPEHHCIGYLKAVSADDALDPAPVKKKPARPGVGKMDQSYAARLLQARSKPHGTEIVRTEPYPGATVQEEGLVREVIPGVNVHKKFKVAPDSIAATQLAELGKGQFDQVTIHTSALAGGDHFSYTFFLRHNPKAPLALGDFVSVKLRALTILGNKTVWVCDRLSGMF